MHTHGSLKVSSFVNLETEFGLNNQDRKNIWTFSNIMQDKAGLLTLRRQCGCMRRIEHNTYSKLHFIKKYVLCFTDRVFFVIFHQLVQRWKLSDPQVVLSLLIFEDLKVLHLVTTPIKVYRVGNKGCFCFSEVVTWQAGALRSS